MRELKKGKVMLALRPDGEVLLETFEKAFFVQPRQQENSSGRVVWKVPAAALECIGAVCARSETEGVVNRLGTYLCEGEILHGTIYIGKYDRLMKACSGMSLEDAEFLQERLRGLALKLQGAIICKGSVREDGFGEYLKVMSVMGDRQNEDIFVWENPGTISQRGIQDCCMRHVERCYDTYMSDRLRKLNGYRESLNSNYPVEVCINGCRNLFKPVPVFIGVEERTDMYQHVI